MGEGEEAYLCNLHDIGSYYPLYSGRNSIGRTEGNAVQLLSRSVSKKHAEIEIDFSRHVPKMILHDLGSSNGTFVNDVRIIGNSRNVRFGDAVRFGYDTQTYKILKDVPLPPGPNSHASPKKSRSPESMRAAGKPSATDDFDANTSMRRAWDDDDSLPSSPPRGSKREDRREEEGGRGGGGERDFAVYTGDKVEEAAHVRRRSRGGGAEEWGEGADSEAERVRPRRGEESERERGGRGGYVESLRQRVEGEGRGEERTRGRSGRSERGGEGGGSPRGSTSRGTSRGRRGDDPYAPHALFGQGAPRYDPREDEGGRSRDGRGGGRPQAWGEEGGGRSSRGGRREEWGASRPGTGFGGGAGDGGGLPMLDGAPDINELLQAGERDIQKELESIREQLRPDLPPSHLTHHSLLPSPHRHRAGGSVEGERDEEEVEEVEDLRRQITALVGELTRKERELEEVGADDLARCLLDAQETVRQLRKGLHAKEAEVRSLQEQIASQHSSTKDSLDQTVAEKSQLVLRLRRELKEWEDRDAQAARRWGEQQEQAAAYASRINELETLLARQRDAAEEDAGARDAELRAMNAKMMEIAGTGDASKLQAARFLVDQVTEQEKAMRLQKEHAMQLEARMTEIKREKEAAEAKLRGYGADDGAADWRERTIQRLKDQITELRAQGGVQVVMEQQEQLQRLNVQLEEQSHALMGLKGEHKRREVKALVHSDNGHLEDEVKARESKVKELEGENRYLRERQTILEEELAALRHQASLSKATRSVAGGPPGAGAGSRPGTGGGGGGGGGRGPGSTGPPRLFGGE